MIELLIYTLFLILAFGIIVWAINQVPLPQPWMRSVIFAILALIFLLILINIWMPAGFWYGGPRGRYP